MLPRQGETAEDELRSGGVVSDPSAELKDNGRRGNLHRTEGRGGACGVVGHWRLNLQCLSDSCVKSWKVKLKCPIHYTAPQPG